jgi:hypothetical protein
MSPVSPVVPFSNFRAACKGGTIVPMFGFFKFWGRAIRSAFAVGWLVFGAVSTLLPAVTSLTQKHWQALASIGWVKWISDNQAESQCYFAALVL